MNKSERILVATKYIAKHLGEYEDLKSLDDYKKEMFDYRRLGVCTEQQLSYFIKLYRLIKDLYFVL